MFDTRKCLIHDLPEWLEIATKELTPLARERIQSEIEAHYAEGIAAHLGEGLFESDAKRSALADLGSPDEAAERFRKQHLTVKDAEIVERAFKQTRSRRGLILRYLLFWGIWFWAEYFYRDKPDHRSFAVLLALGFMAFVVAPSVGFIMMQCRSKSIGSFFLAEGIVVFALGGYIQYFMNGGRDEWIFFFVSFSYVFYPLLRAWLKLRHVANVWDEAPVKNE